MSTSGTTTWSLQRDTLITAALRKISVLSSGQSATSTQISEAAVSLNAMLKAFQVDGMPIWAIKEYTFPTVAGTSSYNIGPAQTLDTPMPLKLIQAYRIAESGDVNVPMRVYTHYDYELLPVNASSGEPINVFYQPFSTYGVIKLWPTPIDATTSVTVTYQRPFEDMTSTDDDFDFPSYWTEAIIYGLAWRLSADYGTPLQDRQLLQKEAEFFHLQAQSFGTEEGSISIMPDWSGQRY
jgi:hypothetical protein